MNDNDVSTGLFKVPFTYPPDPVDGFLVTGFPTPSTVTDFAQPEEIADKIGDPTGLFEDWSYIKDGRYDAFVENITTVAERQTELFLDFIDSYDTDFLMTVYDGSDRIQHFYWKYFDQAHPRYTHDATLSEAIPTYYEVVDQGIGEILDSVDPETDVIILSDHGFGPLSKDVWIDEWLDDNGYLSRYDSNTAEGGRVNALSRTVDVIWSAVERFGVADGVKQILPEEVVLTGGQLRNKPERGINWSETSAFFTNLSGQAIRINVKGEFSEGTVTDDSYDEIVSDIRESLLELEDPETGERIVRHVHHRSDIFDGPAVSDAPDLLVETVPHFTLKDGHMDTLVSPARQHGQDRSGYHRTDGMFIASGPSFVDAELDEPSVLDVAPTLLHLHECPVPASMDGRVLAELLQEPSDVEYVESYDRSDGERRDWTDEEAADLQDQLRSMGYVE